MSLAYINIQETHSKITRQMMNGGHHYGDTKAQETTAEEMFPIFESSMIRSDPEDLRSTFPVQVFGWKATIDVLGKVRVVGWGCLLFVYPHIGNLPTLILSD